MGVYRSRHALAGPLTADRLSAVELPRTSLGRRGYRTDDVDALLHRLVYELGSGPGCSTTPGARTTASSGPCVPGRPRCGRLPASSGLPRPFDPPSRPGLDGRPAGER
ncbi:DivIVA domain-containing protein [Micromonospora sp. BRA006-A]|nr:DivIVA domain-containing protein [Micromonospora sp. BRA006-A]